MDHKTKELIDSLKTVIHIADLSAIDQEEYHAIAVVDNFIHLLEQESKE